MVARRQIDVHVVVQTLAKDIDEGARERVSPAHKSFV
jgi:hypothetical protein